MARIRTVKPDLARHKGLFDLEKSCGYPMRFVWAMLPTICDREGRFEWKPWEFQLDILPYDKDIDFEDVLNILHKHEFIVKFTREGRVYGAIPTFLKHQVINNREKMSEIPALTDEGVEIIKYSDACGTREGRVSEVGKVALRGKEGKGREEERNISPSSADANEDIPAQAELEVDELGWLIELWNELRGPMKAVDRITKNTARYRHVKARLKEHPDPATWRKVFTLMEQSDFLSGRDGKWAGGGFNWLVESSENFQKVLDGNYNPEARASPPKRTWEDAAQKVLEGLQRFGTGTRDTEDMKAFLGPLWEIALKAEGGFYAMRQMPRNEFTKRKLAALLKDSATKIKSQTGGNNG